LGNGVGVEEVESGVIDHPFNGRGRCIE